MPKEIWDNVFQIRRVFKPNQRTECPIQPIPSSTIDIYTNILPQQLQQNNPYQNVFHHPGFMYPHYPTTVATNGIIGPPSPLMFGHPNYMNVLAATQSIVNTAAAAYNNMAQQQRILSPQPTLMTPQFSSPPPPPPPPSQQQIKRKPVQLQSPTTNVFLSSQMKQRKETTLPEQKQQWQPQRHLPPSQYQSRPKKKVTFVDTPEVYIYEPLESEEELLLEEDDENEELLGTIVDNEEEEDYNNKNTLSQSQQQQPSIYYRPTLIEDNEIEENYYNDNEYYTHQELHDHYQRNNHLYSTSPNLNSRRRNIVTMAYPNNGHHYSQYDNDHLLYANSSPFYYDNGELEEEEENYGDLWKRRDLIRRRHSKYRSRA